jgi:hypothetical protein
MFAAIGQPVTPLGSQKELLFSVDEGYCRDFELTKLLQISDFWVFLPKWDSYVTFSMLAEGATPSLSVQCHYRNDKEQRGKEGTEGYKAGQLGEMLWKAIFWICCICCDHEHTTAISTQPSQTQIYTHIHTHVHMHIPIHIHTCIHTNLQTHNHIHMHAQTHTCANNQIHMYIHTHTHWHEHTCIHQHT